MVSSSRGGQNSERTVIYVADLRSTYTYITEVGGGTSHRSRHKKLVTETKALLTLDDTKMGSHVSVYS